MTDKEIIKAFDILDKFEFFGGQRTGRELWLDKPTDIQNKDIDGFLRDLYFLKRFINRQQAEISELQHKIMSCNSEIERLTSNIEAMAQTMHTMAKADRAEAVKEFAERLKEDVMMYFQDGKKIFEGIEIKDIDDLVKEMVGEG